MYVHVNIIFVLMLGNHIGIFLVITLLPSNYIPITLKLHISLLIT
jgi:hypothetical protein